jgi:hypothetical protein
MGRLGGAAKLRGKASLELRQRASEPLHPLELLLIPALAPALVVQVLLTPSRIGPGRLEMAQRIWADPHVLPCGRDRERAYSL